MTDLPDNKFNSAIFTGTEHHYRSDKCMFTDRNGDGAVQSGDSVLSVQPPFQDSFPFLSPVDNNCTAQDMERNAAKFKADVAKEIEYLKERLPAEKPTRWRDKRGAIVTTLQYSFDGRSILVSADEKGMTRSISVRSDSFKLLLIKVPYGAPENEQDPGAIRAGLEEYLQPFDVLFKTEPDSQ